MTYLRNGRTNAMETETPAKKAPTAQPQADGGVRVNGFQQVIDMLLTADPEFRDSLLRRMIKQDPHMGAQLQLALRRAGIL